MPEIVIEDMPLHAEARRQVAAFLQETWPLSSSGGWLRRMTHWWDDNPAVDATSLLGKWVRVGDRVVGFGGAIPALYAFQGERVPAYLATTLRVDEAFPQAVKTLFLHQHQVMQDAVISYTTAIPAIQRVLRRMGGQGEPEVKRFFYPVGPWSHLHGRRGWPPLGQGRRVITDLAEVRSLVRPFQRADRLEKWITPEYLHWYCSSPMREHRFMGVVDAAGSLSSYFILTPRRIRGMRAWDIVEAFSTEPDAAELHALMGTLIREPQRLPGRAYAVTVAAFPMDHRWDGTPAVMCRQQKVCHFYLLPGALRQVPRFTVMAEGDLGL